MKLARACALVGAVLVACWLVRLLFPYLWPFALGAALAWAVEPAAGRLAVRLGRGFAAGVVVGGGVAAVAAVVGLCGWFAAGAIRRLGRLDLYGRAVGASRWFDRTVASLPAPVQRLVEEELARLRPSLGAALGGAAAALHRWAVGDLAGLVLGLVVSLLCAFFLCRDREAVAHAAAALLPDEWSERLGRTWAMLTATLWGFVRAEMVLGLVTLGATWLGLWIIGAPGAPLAALVAALLDVLPVIGPSLLFIPWALAMWFAGLPAAGAALLGVYGAVSLLRWLATPYVLGTRLGLHPLVVLGSVYIGVRLFGVLGLVLGPLAAVVARAVLAAD